MTVWVEDCVRTVLRRNPFNRVPKVQTDYSAISQAKGRRKRFLIILYGVIISGVEVSRFFCFIAECTFGTLCFAFLERG